MIAHPGQPLAPLHLWSAWGFEPGIIGPLVVAAGLYAAGIRALWRSAGTGHGVRRRDAAAFALGWLILALALVSPLHRLGEVLFSVHMVQHELLMTVAAPLLVLGRPLVPFVWGLPPAWRPTAGRWTGAPGFRAAWAALTHPVTAWALHAAAIWLWHLPSLFEATLRSEAVHAIQHASFLGTALLFWWSVLRTRGGRLGWPGAVLALFTTAVHTSLLGALLTFSGRLWYPLYAGATSRWGLTPLEDQQLAGLIMWIPGGIAYLVAALALLASWLAEPGPARAVRRLHAVAPICLLAMLVLAGCDRGGALSAQEAARLTGGGDAARGQIAMQRYGCDACHTVPGLPGARGLVGPPLAGVGGRVYIAGVLTNTPQNMVRWIVDPPGVDPLTAMPALGVSEREARDIASYLYTLR
jgi:cytochrome c oxidase assembly factor CtaG/cytochrome c2